MATERKSGEPATRPHPDAIGRYELLVPIGSGGAATVFLARLHGARGFEREVALKLTHPHLLDEPDSATDVLDEALLASNLRHVNIVSVLDAGDDLFGVYLVMEYVDGDTLAGLMARAERAGESVPFEVAARIVVDALEGLHAAHEARTGEGAPLDLVHRDFSPHNVLVGVDGIARLADFGIAKLVGRKEVTRTGVFKGKVRYAAPEQLRGRAIDRRADIWAAGVVAWEAFASRRLFATDEDAMAFDDAAALPALRGVLPDVPLALEAAIASALVRDPSARVSTAHELRARIVEALGSRLVDRECVAAYVQRTCMEFLARRREKVREVLRARSSPSSVAVPASRASPTGARDRAHDDVATVVLPASNPVPAKRLSRLRSPVRRAPSGAKLETILAAPTDIVVATQVRSTVLLSSFASVKEAGHEEAYRQALPRELHDQVIRSVVGTWLPIELAKAHYAACDALALSQRSIVAIGRNTASRVEGTLLGTVTSMARAWGTTPWTVLALLQRFWLRAFNGGAVTIAKAGPKDAHIDVVGIPLAESEFFRHALGGLAMAVLDRFCTRTWMRQSPDARASESVSYRIQWA